MSKLIVKDATIGCSYVFDDSSSGYVAAQNKVDQLSQAGHKVDLTANNTGKRLKDMESAKSSFFGRLF